MSRIKNALTAARVMALATIDHGLTAFASWAVARGEGISPDPGVKTKNSATATRRIWGYTITDYLDGGPYLTRVLFPRVFGYRPMLHKFHRPDGDRALHNHPWAWACSLILRGSYVEERKLDDEEINGTASPRTTTRRVRWFNVLRDTDFHRVVSLDGPSVWTLFVTGPRVQSWGFLDEHEGFTDWREYIDAKKAEHDSAVTQKKLEAEGQRKLDQILDALQAPAGAELDALGWDMLATKRLKTYKLEGTVSVVDTVEGDAEFRARLERILRGE